MTLNICIMIFAIFIVLAVIINPTNQNAHKLFEAVYMVFVIPGAIVVALGVAILVLAKKKIPQWLEPYVPHDDEGD